MNGRSNLHRLRTFCSLAPCILLCIPLSGAEAGAVPKRPSLEAARQAFHQAEGGQWVIRSDRDGLTPRTLFATKPRPLAGWARNGSAAVRDWIRGHGSLLGPARAEDDMLLTKQMERRALHHLKFQQTYKGVPVQGGEYAVAVEPGGAVRMITGRFHRDLDLKVTPSIPAGVAAVIAGNALPGTHPADETPTLVIVPASELGCGQGSGEDILGWDVTRIELPHKVRWRVLVDARDGSVIAKGDELLHDPPQSPVDCSMGCVHVSDPTSGVSSVPLPGLVPAPPSLCPPALHGSQVFVENMAGAEASPTNELGDFCFDASDQHFVEVNAYYHIESFIGTFLAQRGYDGLASAGTAHVNGTSTPCGTCYQPSTHSWYFFRGPGGANALENMALAADILVHEAQHAVTSSFGIGTDINQSAEANALHEAVSDYFAAVYTQEPRIGEWAYPSICASTGHTWVNSDPEVYHYANYGTVGACQIQPNAPHSNGMILSGALWTLRYMIGPVADEYVLEALSLMPTLPTFACLADAIWAMDQLRGGNLSVQIDATFLERGILGSQASAMHGPGSLAPGELGTYRLVPSCERPPEGAEWFKKCRPCTGSPSCGDWAPVGGGTSVTVSSQARFDIKATWWGRNGEPMEVLRSIAVVPGDAPAPNVEIEEDNTAVCGVTETWTTTATGVAPLQYQWAIRVHYEDIGWSPWGDLETDPAQPVNPDGDRFELKVTVTDPYCRQDDDLIEVAVTCGSQAPQTGHTGTPRPEIVPLRAEVSGGIKVDFVTSETGHARLSLFDVTGRRIGTMWEGQTESGRRSVQWSGRRLEPGLYFLRLDHPTGTVSRRVVVTQD